MDFFGQQDRTRRQSVFLYILFICVFAVMLISIYVCVTAFAFLLSASESPWTPTPYSYVLCAVLATFVILGSIFRFLDVRQGGKKLASVFGATPVLVTSRNAADRELLDIVAEIAVAASAPVPDTYCLRQESTINALVLGNSQDMALVVTQGALDALDREELQGVIAHEFAHIVNADLVHNTRMLIPLGGLNSLDEIGSKMINGSRFVAGAHSSGANKSASLASIPLLLAGYLLRTLGSIGVLGGKLVQSAFSRQRELLADATAIEFTRNSYALASALYQIDSGGSGCALHSEYASELAHMCFQVPTRRRWFSRLFNTHPSLQGRIKAIDPHFAIKSRKTRSRQDSQSSVASENHRTESVPATLSHRFELFASNQMSCLAILYALFMSKSITEAERYVDAIGFSYNQVFKEKVKHVHDMLGDELNQNKVVIIEYIAPALSSLSLENRQQIMLNLEKLLKMEQVNSFENFAAIKLIRQKLNIEFPTLKNRAKDGQEAQSEKPRPIAELGGELSLLLSLMVEASGHSGEKALHDYARVLKCYTSESYPMRSVQEQSVPAELEQAFYALSLQPLTQRQAFVRHCAEIMHFDGIEMAQEKTLINLFAASLGVPELAVA